MHSTCRGWPAAAAHGGHVASAEPPAMIRQRDAIAAGMQSPPPRAGDDLGAATHGDIPDCGLLVGLYIILGGWTVDTRDVKTGWLCA